MKKLILFIFVLFFNLILFSQVNYYPLDNYNSLSPRMIKTNDGGYLLNSAYFNYTPNFTNIEGSSNNRLIKLDVNGNEQWTLLNNYFSRKEMFENSNGDFISVSEKHTGDSFTCQGVSYSFGTKIYFTKISSTGNLITNFELNPGCENSLKSVIKISDNKYAVVATYYSGVSQSNPESHIFYFDNDGNIIDDHTYSNQEFESANLFLDNLGKINVMYINENNDLVLNILDSSLNIQSEYTYPNFNSLFPANSYFFNLNNSQLSNNNISLYAKYSSWTTSNNNINIITFDNTLNYLEHHNYEMPNRTNRVFNQNNDNSTIAYEYYNSGTMESELKLNFFNENGVNIASNTLNLPFDNESPSNIVYNNDDNTFIVLGDINSYNLDSAIGPAVPFVVFENQFLSINNYSSIQFDIYPNPTSNVLNIISKSEIIKIEVYNNLGQLITKNTFKSNIDISKLINGIYYLKILDNIGNFQIKKVLKK